jgi:hypothetical protein
VPFEGESVGEVLMKHLTTDPDLSALAEPFRSVVATALQKDPAKRFKSVPDMLAALPRPPRPEVYAGPLPSTGSGRGNHATTTPGVPPIPAAIPLAEAVDEEPIYGSVRRLCKNACDAWNRSSFNSPTKIAMVVVGASVLLMTSHGWVPVVVFLVTLYACYWVVRAILTTFAPHQRLATLPAQGATPSAPPNGLAAAAGGRPATPPAPPRGGPQRHRGFYAHDAANDVLVLGSPRERFAQWIGSLAGGALVTLTVCLVMLVLNGFRDTASEPQLWGMTWWAQYAWLVAVSLAGAWAVLTASKFWEGKPGDAMMRRFVLMVVGLGLGLAAFGATSWFAVELTHDKQFMQLATFRAHRPLLPADGWPAVKYYLAAFATLFAVVRWWRQADPARGARMSLWAIIVSVFVAALVADVWGFPQPWLPMVACSVSVAVQLASTWIHPRERRWQGPSA